MKPENEKSAFVIRCAIQTETSHVLESHIDKDIIAETLRRLENKDSISFKFDINGKIVEYQDPDLDISFDVSEREWVMVLDDIPFDLENKTIKLIDIQYKCYKNLQFRDDVVFVVHSFESTCWSATLSFRIGTEQQDASDKKASLVRPVQGDEKNCYLELRYYATDTNAVTNNIEHVSISLPDNITIKLFIDHNRPIRTIPGYNYRYETRYAIAGVIGDDDLTHVDWSEAVISDIKWDGVRPTVLFESAGIIIIGKCYGIVPLSSISDDITPNEIKREKMGIQLKNSSIPVEPPVFIIHATVSSAYFREDLEKLKSIIINLDGIHYIIHKFEAIDVEYQGKDDPNDPMKNNVSFKIRPFAMMSYGCESDAKMLHFGDIVIRDFTFESDVSSGFHLLIKEIMFNGSEVKVRLDTFHNRYVEYQEPIIIQEGKDPDPVTPANEEENQEEVTSAVKEESVAFKITLKDCDVDFYQVRAITMDELKVPGPLKVEEVKTTIHNKFNIRSYMDMTSTNVCSELVVGPNCHIENVVVLSGGTLMIEEGGHVDHIFVHTGGMVELYHGAVVDVASECGGAIYGDVSKVRFTGNEMHYGDICRNHYATLHEGSIMNTIRIYGKLDAHNNTHTNSCSVYGEMHIRGGYHDLLCVKAGGSLYICGGVIKHLYADNGSRVVIFKGATVIEATIHGSLEYEGDDITTDPNIIALKSDEVAKCFKLEDRFSVGDILSELDK